MNKKDFLIILGVLIGVILLLFIYQWVLRRNNPQIEYGLYIKIHDKHLGSDIYVGLLLKPRVLNDMPCKAGPSLIFPSGFPHFCWLSEAYSYRGDMLPRNSKLYFKKPGVLDRVYLSTDVIVQGWHVSAADRMAEMHIALYENGAIYSLKPAKDTTINSIPVLGDGRSELALYPDGSVMGAYLSEDCEFEGRAFSKRSRILRDRDGRINAYSPGEHSAIRRVIQ